MSDSPNFKSPQYVAHESQITTVTAIYNGVDTAKAYIREYAQEDATDYSQRKNDATLGNFVFQTIDTIQNIIFRKPIDKENITNPTILEYTSKIDLNQSLNEFSKDVLISRIKDGYTFVMADSISYNADEVTNQAQQEDANIRPYLVNILRENVLNWTLNNGGGFARMSIRDFETVSVGKFGSEIKQITKVYYEDGTVETYNDKDELTNSIQRSFIGIPIVQIGDNLVPSLYDMTKININHLNRNSELDNYVRIGGAPFPIITGQLMGDDDGNAPKTMSINQGLHFRDNEGGFVWAEMSGANSTMIQERINYYEDQMLKVAIDFTTEQSNKTATQVEKESMVGESKLTGLATEIEEGINESLANMSLFMTDNVGENTIRVNKDYNNAVLTPEQANSYRMDYMQGIISLERLWSLLEKGEYLPITTDKEKEIEKANVNTIDGGVN